MPAPGFSVIEQYRSLAKDLEHQDSDKMLSFDQEVPQSCYAPEEIKHEILDDDFEERGDIINHMFGRILTNGSSTSNNMFTTSVNLPLSCQTDVLGSNRLAPMTMASPPLSSLSPSPSSSSSASSSASLSSSPRMLASESSSLPSPSPPTLLSVFPSASVSSSSLVTNSSSSSNTFSSPKTSTFITELGGSGCTVVTNVDFLSDNASACLTPPSMGIHDEGLDFIDLDRQPVSLYDEIETLTSAKHVTQEDSVPLEEAVFLMRDVIHSDCDNLNVPYDPQEWTNQQVMKWVSWVCQKNRVPDVSRHLMGVDGRTLCSISQQIFAQSYGNSGQSIYAELELWKAANSCFPHQEMPPARGHLIFQHLHNPYMEQPHTFHVTPSVSPAPSTCSSTHDSNGSSSMSSHSDHSDDENSHNSPPRRASRFEGRVTSKLTSGRGHKQTIHLWQFLRELLLSSDNQSDCIRWLDRGAGIFKIEDSKKVAHLWGQRKNRPAMNYDKLSRSVRQYYKKGIIKKTDQSKRLVYQFCPGYL